MRPIDADAINPMRCPQSIAEMQKWIDSIPTIEAIPISFLREKGRYLRDNNLKDEAFAVICIIEAWREEQRGRADVHQ